MINQPSESIPGASAAKEERRKRRLAMTLQLSTLPEVSDPRIERRALTVLDYAYDLRVSPGGARAIRATDLYEVTGTPRASNPKAPANYFKTLFRQVGSFTAGDGTYKYVAVARRVDRLASTLDYQDGLSRAAAKRGWSFHEAPPPRASLPRTGDRVYPWWAQMASEVRHALFIEQHGQGFDYDIEAAKPTVTLQAWRKLMQQYKPAALKKAECSLPAWTALVADRTAFRSRMSMEAKISMAQAKEVCQVVLNGGWVAPHRENGLFKILGEAGCRRVAEAQTYKALREDFKVFWRNLQELDGLAMLGLVDSWTVADESGDPRTITTSTGQALMAFYTRIEDQIMFAVEEILSSRNIETWFIHDGFMTKAKIAKAEVEQHVFLRAGFHIKLEEIDLCKSADLA